MSKIREMLPAEYGLLDEFLYQAIHTEPSHRGRGVGTALLSSLIGRCLRLGHPELSLLVQRSNPAVRLYERLGFREVSGDDGEAVMVLTAGSQGRCAREARA